MTATARVFEVTAEDLAGGRSTEGQGNFSDVECPGQHVGTVTDIIDWVAKGKTEVGSYKVTITVDTVSGPVPFNTWLPISKGARFRLTGFATSCGDEVGINDRWTFDPEKYIGAELGLEIDWQKDRETGEDTSYREIKETFPLAEAPDVADAPNLEEPEVL